MISGFHRVVNVIFALLGCYAAYNGSYLPTFRDTLSVPSSRFKGQGSVPDDEHRDGCRNVVLHDAAAILRNLYWEMRSPNM